MFKRIAGLLLMVACVLILSVCYADNNATKVEKITLSESNVLVCVGKNISIKADVEPANATEKHVKWESSDSRIATVANGTIVGKTSGECDITCTAFDGGDANASCHVTVWVPVQNVSINEKNITLLIGADEASSEMQLSYTIKPENAYYQTGSWTSSKEDVVTVDSHGVLHAKQAGNATVTFISGDPSGQKKAQVNVKVIQAINAIKLDNDKMNLPVRKTQAIKANIEPANAANKKVDWSSSDESVAKVNASGQVQGINPGTAIITAAANDGSGITATCEVTVVQPVNSIAVADKKVDLAPGIPWIQTVTVEPENATIKEIVWTSSNVAVATVNENGVIKGNSVGKCQIVGTATDGSAKKINVDINVQEFDAIILSPGTTQVEFNIGEHQAMMGMQIGNRFYGDIYETKVKVKNGCVEILPDNCLNPLKAGADIITVTETHNRKKIGSKTYKVYVAQSAFLDMSSLDASDSDFISGDDGPIKFNGVYYYEDGIGFSCLRFMENNIVIFEGPYSEIPLSSEMSYSSGNALLGNYTVEENRISFTVKGLDMNRGYAEDEYSGIIDGYAINFNIVYKKSQDSKYERKFIYHPDKADPPKSEEELLGSTTRDEILFRNIPWGSKESAVIKKVPSYTGFWEAEKNDHGSYYTLSRASFNKNKTVVADHETSNVVCEFVYEINDQGKLKSSGLFYKGKYLFRKDNDAASRDLENKLIELYGTPDLSAETKTGKNMIWYGKNQTKLTFTIETDNMSLIYESLEIGKKRAEADEAYRIQQELEEEKKKQPKTYSDSKNGL